MFKEFNICEYKDSSLLKCILKDILSIKFFDLSLNDKWDTLYALDKCVSDLCGMPYAVFVNKKNDIDMIDNIYIGDLKDYDFGLNVIYGYFFGKRQQYQRYCVEQNNEGSFRKDEFEAIKYNYMYTPITNKKLEIPYKNNFSRMLLNYNKSDACLYAFNQVNDILDVIDYTELFEKYSFLERIKFIFLMHNNLKTQTRMIKRIQNLFKNKMWQNKFFSKVDDYENKVAEEYKFLTKLNKNIDNDSYALCCFNENVWNKLTVLGKAIAIERINEILSDECCVFSKTLNYSEWKLIEVNENFASIGDLETGNGRDIFNALIYSYAYSVVLNKMFFKKELAILNCVDCLENDRDFYEKNEFSKITNKDFLNKVSMVAVKLQKNVYNYIKNDPVLKSYNIDFLGDKKDFIYDLSNDLKRKGGRK